jgi:hypothetical protein
MPPGPEYYVRRDIKLMAEALGFAVYDLEQNRKTRQTPGLADLYLLHRGFKLELWVETKAGNNTPSPAQEIFYELVWASGGIVVWCWSDEDFAWVLYWLGLITHAPIYDPSEKILKQKNVIQARPRPQREMMGVP